MFPFFIEIRVCKRIKFTVRVVYSTRYVHHHPPLGRFVFLREMIQSTPLFLYPNVRHFHRHLVALDVSFFIFFFHGQVPYGAHGYGAAFTLSVMDREYIKGLTVDEALSIIDNCINQLHTRFLIAQKNFVIKVRSETYILGKLYDDDDKLVSHSHYKK